MAKQFQSSKGLLMVENHGNESLIAEGGEVQHYVDGGSVGSFDSMVSDAPQSTPGSLPSFDEMQDDSEKYGTPGQILKGHAEALGRGVISSPAMSYLETKAGVKPEDIRGREENVPGTALTEGAGFLGSAFTPFGQASMLGKLGKAAEAATGVYKGVNAAREGVKAAELLQKSGNFIGSAEGLIDTARAVQEAKDSVTTAQQALPTLHKAGAEALKQAVEFGALQGSDEVNKMILKDPGASADSAAANIGATALIGAGIGGLTGGVVSPLWNATLGPKLESVLNSIQASKEAGIQSATPDNNIRPYVKKLLARFGGVSEEMQDKYLELKGKGIMDSVPEFEDLYNKTQSHVDDIYNRVTEGKASASSAKASLDAHIKDLAAEFKAGGVEAGLADRMAKQSVKDASAKMVSDIRETALNSGRTVASAVEGLHQKIVDGSAKAYDVLEKSGLDVDLKPFMGKIEDLAKELEGYGTQDSFKQAENIRNYGEGLRRQFSEAGDSLMAKPSRMVISGPEAKQLIQGLDRSGKMVFSDNATNFDRGMSQAYKDLRHELSEHLKDKVPEYRKAMKPLSEDTSLSTKLKKYGTPEGATRGVSNLKNDVNYKNEMPLLRQLEESTGAKFTHDIEPFANPEMRERLLQSLPEHKEAERTAELLSKFNDPKFKEAMVDEAAKNSIFHEGLQKAMAELREAEAAKANLGHIKGNVEPKLRAGKREGKNFAIKEGLEKLPKINGYSVPEILEALHVKEYLERNITHGSKNVNMYTLLMAGVGKAFSMHELGMVGALLGGPSLGALMDEQGPQIVKKILDHISTHYGDVATLSQEKGLGNARAMLAKLLTQDSVGHSAADFKSGVDYVSTLRKSQDVLNKSAKNVLKPGTSLSLRIPDAASREKLDKLVAKQGSEQPDTTQKPHSYLGDHQEALNATKARIVQYLRDLKPQPKQLGVFDKPLPPSKAEIARYNRALDIAQNPNLVFEKLQRGTLQPSDIQDLHAMYPAYYPQMAQALQKAMVELKNEEEPLPYKVRMGISMLLGSPLDSTMQPQSIQSAQSVFIQQQPPQPQGSQGKPSKMNNKGSNAYKTPNQEAESDRSSRD